MSSKEDYETLGEWREHSKASRRIGTRVDYRQTGGSALQATRVNPVWGWRGERYAISHFKCD